MASPQTENGFTQIANETMDALARIRIPGQARQVLDFIIRKTYGWNKKIDVISLSQFAKGTGLSKVAVCKSINKLLRLKIITQKGNERNVTYGFNKNYDRWKPLPKKVILPKKVTTFTQKGNPGGILPSSTKDTSTKEIKDIYVQKNEEPKKSKPPKKDELTKEQRILFDIFWKEYPKRQSKSESKTTWKKIDPDQQLLEKILISINQAKKTRSWIEKNGRYIPLPSTWLNNKRWEDEFDERDYKSAKKTNANTDEAESDGEAWPKGKIIE